MIYSNFKYGRISEKDFKTAYVASHMAHNGNSPVAAIYEAEKAWENYLAVAQRMDRGAYTDDYR